MRPGKRTLIQLAAALITNANLKGFLEGSIYQGPGKSVCVPGLNCYSCPGAIGSCPIGSLQAVIGSRGKMISYYITGTLILFGVLFGRMICGFLCPFGWFQDLLYRIPLRKINVNPKIDRLFRYLKYLILAVFVILLPMLIRDAFGFGDPYFCKYICPAGTLEGGIPLITQNESLQSMLGLLFSWKMFLLILFLLSSTMIYRPFCKYICPLGAVYGLFNKHSFYQMKLDHNSCTGCKKCEKVCKMQVQVTKDINSSECIRCGDCTKVCPEHAITSGYLTKKNESKALEQQKISK